MTSGRKCEERRQTDYVKVLLWIYWGMEMVFEGWWGSRGWWWGGGRVCGCGWLLKRSSLVINAPRFRISRRVCGIEKSQRRKRCKGRETNWEFFVEEKYNPLSLFYCTGHDPTTLCYDWALWVILSSGQKQWGDESFWDGGSDVMFYQQDFTGSTSWASICSAPELLVFEIVWAVTVWNNHRHLYTCMHTYIPPIMHLPHNCLILIQVIIYLRLICDSWLHFQYLPWKVSRWFKVTF